MISETRPIIRDAPLCDSTGDNPIQSQKYKLKKIKQQERIKMFKSLTGMVYARSTTDSPVASCDFEEFRKSTPAIPAASKKYNPNVIENELEALAAPSSYSGPKHTTERFVELVKNNSTQIISLLHVGEDGLIKTLDFCPANETSLISILEGGERCDGSSIFPNSGIEASSSDIVLRPRLDTAFFDPFAPIPKSVLCFFCWHYGTDGQLLPQSPETIIHRAEEELLKKGHTLWSHGEIEFLLGKKVINHLESGLIGSDHGYHAAAPYVFGQDLRREAITILATLGVHVKYGHSENGYIPADQNDPITWEQHEVSYGFFFVRLELSFCRLLTLSVINTRLNLHWSLSARQLGRVF
jgi:hypothetical protein